MNQIFLEPKNEDIASLLNTLVRLGIVGQAPAVVVSVPEIGSAEILARLLDAAGQEFHLVIPEEPVSSDPQAQAKEIHESWGIASGKRGPAFSKEPAQEEINPEFIKQRVGAGPNDEPAAGPRCEFCGSPLTGKQTKHCGKADCKKAYQRQYWQDRKKTPSETGPVEGFTSFALHAAQSEPSDGPQESDEVKTYDPGAALEEVPYPFLDRTLPVGEEVTIHPIEPSTPANVPPRPSEEHIYLVNNKLWLTQFQMTIQLDTGLMVAGSKVRDMNGKIYKVVLDGKHLKLHEVKTERSAAAVESNGTAH